MAEAKAKLSELLAYASEGHTVTITDEGEPLAEIRRLKPLPRNTEERIEELKRRGVIVPAKFDKSEIGPRQRVPGALARFLADRND
jgi:prevent-host-death family protein